MHAVRTRVPTLLEYGFRPFFLLAALYAVLAIALWLAQLQGMRWPGAPLNPLTWHVHEMLGGFIAAAIAGFLLTAVPNWTGRPPMTGVPLALLVAAWLAGRLATGFSGALPGTAVLVIDSLFWAGLLARTGRELWLGGQARQWPLPALLTLLLLANATFHAAQAGWIAISPLQPLYLQMHVILGLIVLIGGRIIPAFTRNWMSARGKAPLPRSRVPVEIAAVLATIAVATVHLLAPASTLLGVVALLAAAAHAARLAGWKGWRTAGEGLLWILHVGYGWLVVGYALLGLHALGLGPGQAVALHVLTIGCMGTMVIAVMARAGLGHTGRRLSAGPLLMTAFLLVSAAALLRIPGSLAGFAAVPWLAVSGVAWMAGFGIFLANFWPVLSRPRVDVAACHAPR